MMIARFVRTAIVTAGVLCVAAAQLDAVDVPLLSGRVVDDANIITTAARQRLTAALKAHEDATTNQIVVLTVPTIQPESIEDYAVKVFQAWKLGQKGKDNGVLVVIVPRDHKLRIEVGYGLEPVLTDGAAGEIIRTVITPWFKAGNYDRGIEDGVAAIINRLEGKASALPAVDLPAAATGPPPMGWAQRIGIGIFVFGMIGLFTVLGVVTPGLGWFLYVFLIPFWAIFPRVVLGRSMALMLLAAYVIGYPLAKMRVSQLPWYKKAKQSLKEKGFANVGGFTINSGGDGGSSGGFFGGGGFSGGGEFSGGGGSSGGGGASGGW